MRPLAQGRRTRQCPACSRTCPARPSRASARNWPALMTVAVSIRTNHWFMIFCERIHRAAAKGLRPAPRSVCGYQHVAHVTVPGIPAVPLAGLLGNAWHLATVFCLQIPECLLPIAVGTAFRLMDAPLHWAGPDQADIHQAERATSSRTAPARRLNGVADLFTAVTPNTEGRFGARRRDGDSEQPERGVVGAAHQLVVEGDAADAPVRGQYPGLRLDLLSREHALHGTSRQPSPSTVSCAARSSCRCDSTREARPSSGRTRCSPAGRGPQAWSLVRRDDTDACIAHARGLSWD